MFVCLFVFSERNNSANLDMGKSSFPEGDLDPLRSQERITKTTNDYFFGNVSLYFLWLVLLVYFSVYLYKYIHKESIVPLTP